MRADLVSVQHVALPVVIRYTASGTDLRASAEYHHKHHAYAQLLAGQSSLFYYSNNRSW
jgi:hypothetical protein